MHSRSGWPRHAPPRARCRAKRTSPATRAARGKAASCSPCRGPEAAGALATRQALAPDRNPWPWAAAGIGLGLLAAVLLFLPASWLAAQIESSSEGRVVLADAQGTVWNGSATLLLTGGEGSNDSLSLPTPVVWRIRPRPTGLRVEIISA